MIRQTKGRLWTVSGVSKLSRRLAVRSSCTRSVTVLPFRPSVSGGRLEVKVECSAFTQVSKRRIPLSYPPVTKGLCKGYNPVGGPRILHFSASQDESPSPIIYLLFLQKRVFGSEHNDIICGVCSVSLCLS